MRFNGILARPSLRLNKGYLQLPTVLIWRRERWQFVSECTWSSFPKRNSSAGRRHSVFFLHWRCKKIPLCIGAVLIIVWENHASGNSTQRENLIEYDVDWSLHTKSCACETKRVIMLTIFGDTDIQPWLFSRWKHWYCQIKNPVLLQTDDIVLLWNGDHKPVNCTDSQSQEVRIVQTYLAFCCLLLLKMRSFLRNQSKKWYVDDDWRRSLSESLPCADEFQVR